MLCYLIHRYSLGWISLDYPFRINQQQELFETWEISMIKLLMIGRMLSVPQIFMSIVRLNISWLETTLIKKVNPRHMTVDHQVKSLQYFYSKNRIPTNHLDDTRSRGDIADLPVSAFLPTPADCSVLLSNYIILVSRIIVKHIPSLLSKRWCQWIFNISTQKKWRKHLKWYV